VFVLGKTGPAAIELRSPNRRTMKEEKRGNYILVLLRE